MALPRGEKVASNAEGEGGAEGVARAAEAVGGRGLGELKVEGEAREAVEPGVREGSAGEGVPLLLPPAPAKAGVEEGGAVSLLVGVGAEVGV